MGTLSHSLSGRLICSFNGRDLEIATKEGRMSRGSETPPTEIGRLIIRYSCPLRDSLSHSLSTRSISVDRSLYRSLYTRLI